MAEKSLANTRQRAVFRLAATQGGTPDAIHAADGLMEKLENLVGEELERLLSRENPRDGVKVVPRPPEKK